MESPAMEFGIGGTTSLGSSEKILKAPETVLRHLQYVQRRVFHDQLEQLPNTADPLEVLRTGQGKCGQVALALSYLLDRSGVENRIVRLLKHVVVEARWDGRWHLLDADLFKHGVVPASDDGSIPSLREVQGNYLIDRFPPTMYVYTREYIHFRRKPDHVLRGFIEHHQAGFMSHYYQMNLGLQLEYPPGRPVDLNAKVSSSGTVVLQWSPSQDFDNDLLGYEVMISQRSRGWNYDDPAYERVPEDTSKTCAFTEYPKLELKPEKGRYYWSVRAVDDHRRKEPRTYYFPSNELEFTVT